MKKLLTIFLSCFCLYTLTNAQSVSVNTDGSTADASSILDVKSTTKGMLAPRMTTAQRTAIVAPASGLLVYDTDVKSFWYYNGVAWANITGSGGGGSFILPYDAIANLPGTAFRILNNSNALEGSSTNGAGVYGYSENGSGISASSASGFGILASSSQATAIRAFSGNANPTIHATNTNASGVAISGSSSLFDGILGVSAGSGKAGVRGEATGSTGVGVFGTATAANGYGVRGFSVDGIGVSGQSTNGYGISAFSNDGTGLRTSSTTGLALDVYGKMKILGTGTAPGNGYVLTSDNAGNADWKPLNLPPKISFRATGTADNNFTVNLVSSNNTTVDPLIFDKVEFRNERYDKVNNYTPYTGTYSSSTSTFTTSIAGIYHFDASINFMYNLTLDYREVEIAIMLERNGSVSILAKNGSYINSVDNTRASISTDLHLQADDRVWIGVRQYNILETPSYLTISNEDNYFTGHIVFAD